MVVNRSRKGNMYSKLRLNFIYMFLFLFDKNPSHRDHFIELTTPKERKADLISGEAV